MACCVIHELLDLEVVWSSEVLESSSPGTQQLGCPMLLGAFPFWKIRIFLLLGK